MPRKFLRVHHSNRPSRWSYLVNLTFIGNAVYMSMDIPDTFLAVRYVCRGMLHFYSTPLDVVLQTAQLPPAGDGQNGGLCGSPCHLVVSPYLQYSRWDAIEYCHSYFRLWLNLRMLWSVWTEFDLIPYVICPVLASPLTELDAEMNQSNGSQSQVLGSFGG